MDQRVQMSGLVIIAVELFDPSNYGFREELEEEKKAKNERSPSAFI